MSASDMDSLPQPASPTLAELLHDQPLKTIVRDDVEFVLLGTAHVSRASVDAVNNALDHTAFDAVAVELCEARYQSMIKPDSLAELDLFRVIQEGKSGMVAANLALSAYQRRLAEQLKIEPGAEMRAAIDHAERQSQALWKIDRDVGVTLRRTYSSVGWWQRAKLMGGLIGSVLVDEQVDAEEIEKLKQGDMLESTFSEFAQRSDKLYHALIAERDQFMAAELRRHAAELPNNGYARRVLVVVGAGHLAGLARHLADDQQHPVELSRALTALPPPTRWGTWFSLIFAALVLGGFAWGFASGVELGTELVLAWVLATGTLGALGCAIAGGHPLSIIAAFVASPLTPLHPFLASGTVSALVELTLRRPTVADFSSLRDDVTSLSGWWRNRVSRVLVNFFLTSFGTAIGVYLAGWRMLEALL
ncbi:TraB/GumN family protein [Pseudomarimonas arenosa]|uniref:TraB/GumN family protein n=1 Tax=Pseudomarimonas arenosa TaxID=2774145 RepID=A0AAW3ZMA0_9GAMM|nr:TraB/GumN family protein [Pseudomarimonas arenosa]MBD8526299.1 TraB/GumN family protein [Pseudomarimonas arenosa]